MPQRVIYYTVLHDKLLGPAPEAAIGKYAGGTVAALADDGALTMLRAPGVSLLFFSKESCERYLRQLSERDRDEAIGKRLTAWAPNAVSEGIDWLYRGERGNLARAARSGSADGFENALAALDRLANEGAYGSVFVPAILVYVLQSEALLLAELALDRLTPEVSERHEFSLAIAGELESLGRPQFAQHLPYAEAMRAAFATPADPGLVGSLKSLRLPTVEWRDGVVSIFGSGDLESMAKEGKYKTRVLYPDARQFRQDLADLTRSQLFREFEERSEAGPMPFWTDHLNVLRLETALMRRAAYQKTLTESPRAAALLSGQIRQETVLFRKELGAHPSWLDAESGGLEDVMFLVRFSGVRGPEDVHRRYQSFADFKTAQTR
ncbi:MAG: hypothetical protein ABSC93_15085 [Bryobacteraceae bacterium]|jgi:hypothetical protein